MACNARTSGRVLLLVAALAASAACGDDNGQGAGAVDAELRIHHEHRDAGIDRTYTIICTGSSSELRGDGAGVDAGTACDALADPAVVERLTEGPPDNVVCTQIYGGPDTAAIQGTIGVRSVDAMADRTDGCAIRDWDDVLDAILPPAIGVMAPPTTS